MKLIPLTKGKFAMVDDEDYEYLIQWKWNVVTSPSGNSYAIRRVTENGKGKTILMHRALLNPPENMCIDHEDGNGLNNQRNNIRVCTLSQNGANRKATGTSKYLGVYFINQKQKYILKNGEIRYSYTQYWIARLQKDYKYLLHRYFKTEKEAALAYNEAAIKYHGEFAKLNIID